MKTIILGVFAAMLLTGGVAYASTDAASPHGAQPPAASDATQLARNSHVAKRLSAEDPTDLPAYEFRSDGLMINGLLPAPGWQG